MPFPSGTNNPSNKRSAEKAAMATRRSASQATYDVKRRKRKFPSSPTKSTVESDSDDDEDDSDEQQDTTTTTTTSLKRAASHRKNSNVKTAMPYKICEVISNKKSNGQDKDFENNKIKKNKSFVVVKVYVVKNEEQHSFRPNGETTNYTFDDLWNTETIVMGPSSSSDGSTRCLSHDNLYGLYHSH